MQYKVSLLSQDNNKIKEYQNLQKEFNEKLNLDISF